MGSLTFGRISGGLVVRLQGHGTLRESRALNDLLKAAPAQGRLDLDLRKTDWLDSTFLGSLMALHKRLNQPEAIRFRICAEPAHTQKLFGRTRLDTMIPQAQEPDAPKSPEEHVPEAVMDTAGLAAFVADCHRRLAELGGPDSSTYASVAEAFKSPP